MLVLERLALSAYVFWAPAWPLNGRRKSGSLALFCLTLRAHHPAHNGPPGRLYPTCQRAALSPCRFCTSLPALALDCSQYAYASRIKCAWRVVVHPSSFYTTAAAQCCLLVRSSRSTVARRAGWPAADNCPHSKALADALRFVRKANHHASRASALLAAPMSPVRGAGSIANARPSRRAAFGLPGFFSCFRFTASQAPTLRATPRCRPGWLPRNGALHSCFLSDAHAAPGAS